MSAFAIGHRQGSPRELRRQTCSPLRTAVVLTIVGLVAGCNDHANSSTASVQSYQADQSYKNSKGVAVYIGVMPAAIVKGYPAAVPESKMHGGPPTGATEYHLVVALFDAETGVRISDAVVKARISERNSSGAELTLQSMDIADSVTYGGFVSFPATGRYSIRISVERYGAAPVAFDFIHDH